MIIKNLVNGYMYIKKFIIRNFRALEFLELDFKKGLNIIIGENNSGKTAIIDALRLCLSDFQQPRDIYCSSTDFRIDKSDINCERKNIEFDLFFKCENHMETVWFSDLHVLDDEGNDSLQLHFKFELIDTKIDTRVKRTVWGGEKEGGKVPSEVLSALRNVYLSALRDANKDLRPIKGNILGNLYSNIRINEEEELDKEEKENLLKLIADMLNKGEWKDFIEKGSDIILEHLEHLSYLTPEKKQSVDIGFAPFEFNKFVQKLIMQLPVYSADLIDENNMQQYFEIWQNGLGLNNLIYTAAILGDIKQRKSISKEEYNLLLIEEPEAHLHPQLENTFFNYLKRLDEDHEFQIIVTSHSPTIAAKTNLKLLTILQNHQNKICSTQIEDLKLEGESIEYLQKFLDVTKSQLFFANSVILVEGISEAILIPIFSKILVDELGEKYDIERNGIEVVNIEGIAFKHFAKLFNSDDEKKRLNCRCAIITDNDEDKKSKSVRNRVKNISKLTGGNLEVKFAKKTFEYELFKVNRKSKALSDVFFKIHPEIHKNIFEIKDNPCKQAKLFAEAIDRNRSKSKFAYLLAIELEKNRKSAGLVVPDYIKETIDFVINGT